MGKALICNVENLLFVSLICLKFFVWHIQIHTFIGKTCSWWLSLTSLCRFPDSISAYQFSFSLTNLTFCCDASGETSSWRKNTHTQLCIGTTAMSTLSASPQKVGPFILLLLLWICYRLSPRTCLICDPLAKGTNLLSGGIESVLVQWKYNQESQRDFLPRLGATITHIAVSPDGALFCTSHSDNSEQRKFLFKPLQPTLGGCM